MLVKWAGEGYDEATWEPLADASGDAAQRCEARVAMGAVLLRGGQDGEDGHARACRPTACAHSRRTCARVRTAERPRCVGSVSVASCAPPKPIGVVLGLC